MKRLLKWKSVHGSYYGQTLAGVTIVSAVYALTGRGYQLQSGAPGLLGKGDALVRYDTREEAIEAAERLYRAWLETLPGVNV